MKTQREIFPYALANNQPPSKDKGLSELVRLCFGKALNKSEQCSNWERRPLRDAQIQYAGKADDKIVSFSMIIVWFILAADAYCLLDVYQFLCDRPQLSDYLRSFRGEKQIPVPPPPPPTTTNDPISTL